STEMAAASGSTSTGISPAASTPATSSTWHSRAVTSSTCVFPCATAWEKATVRRMVVGRAISVMITESPACRSRRAMPLARSAAPRMSTRMVSSPLLGEGAVVKGDDSVVFVPVAGDGLIYGGLNLALPGFEVKGQHQVEDQVGVLGA